MSILTIVGHTFQAIEGTCIGARLLGHPVEPLDAVSETLRPIRAQVSHERAQETSQQMGNVQQSVSPDGDVAGESAIDTGDESILKFIANGIEWIFDKL